MDNNLKIKKAYYEFAGCVIVMKSSGVEYPYMALCTSPLIEHTNGTSAWNTAGGMYVSLPDYSFFVKNPEGNKNVVRIATEIEKRKFYEAMAREYLRSNYPSMTDEEFNDAIDQSACE